MNSNSLIEVVDKKIKQIKFEDLKDDKSIFFGHKNIQINTDILIMTGRNGCGKTKFLKMLEDNSQTEKLSVIFNLHQFDTTKKPLTKGRLIDVSIDKNFIQQIIINITNPQKIKDEMKEKQTDLLDINVENLVEKEIEKYCKDEKCKDEKSIDAKLLANYLFMMKEYSKISANVSNNPIKLIGEISYVQEEIEKYLIEEQEWTENEIAFLKNKSDSSKEINDFEKLRDKSSSNELKDSCNKEIKNILIKELISDYGKFKNPLESINSDLKLFSLMIKYEKIENMYKCKEINAEIMKKKSGKESNEFEKIEPSSGELFIINIFAMKFINTKFLPVNIVLLDEPDRHLEPKLIEIFFSVVKDLSNHGLQIFMTTHRPDTISLADPDSIWILDLDKQTHRRQIKKCHKYAALFKLTFNLREIMNFKIKVYVESHTDSKFYEIMYGILLKYSNEIRKQNQDILCPLGFEKNRILSRRYQLEFCSSAKTPTGGQGGKNSVLDFLKRELSSIRFQENARKNCDSLDLFKPYGLRDYDEGLEKNYEKEFNRNSDLRERIVRTKRYSLENYLYDPILICSLFDEDFLKKSNLDFLVSIKNSVNANSEPDYSIFMDKLEEFEDIKKKITELLNKDLREKDEKVENGYIFKFKEKEPLTIKYPKVLKVLKGHLIEKVFEDIFSNGLISRIESEIDRLSNYFKNESKSELKINDKDSFLNVLYKHSLSFTESNDDKLQKTFDGIFRKIIEFILDIHPYLIFKESDYFKQKKMTDVKDCVDVSDEFRKELGNGEYFCFPEGYKLDIKNDKDLQILCKMFIPQSIDSNQNDDMECLIVTNILEDRQDDVKYPKIFKFIKSNIIVDINKNVLPTIFEGSSYNCITLGDKILEKLNEMLENTDQFFYFPLDLAENFFELNKKVREQITNIIKKP